MRRFNNVESTAYLFAVNTQLIQCRVYFNDAYNLTPGSTVRLYAVGYGEKPTHGESTRTKTGETDYTNYEVLSRKNLGSGWMGLQEAIDDRQWNSSMNPFEDDRGWFDACALARLLQLQLFNCMPTEVVLIDVKRL